jgi:hypothetical protein
LRIQDAVTNFSAYEQEFELIYHANYGPPLLEKGARFVGAVKRITALQRARGQEHGELRRIRPRRPKAFIEQVYVIEPFADAQNRTTVMLHNAAGDKAVTMTYAIDQLPYFTLWKNTTCVGRGLCHWLEPGTSSPANRSIERKAGRVPKLRPNETRDFAIEVGILEGRKQSGAEWRQSMRCKQDGSRRSMLSRSKWNEKSWCYSRGLSLRINVVGKTVSLVGISGGSIWIIPPITPTSIVVSRVIASSSVNRNLVIENLTKPGVAISMSYSPAGKFTKRNRPFSFDRA